MRFLIKSKGLKIIPNNNNNNALQNSAIGVFLLYRGDLFDFSLYNETGY